MPRLLPGAPALAVSGDGATIAVLDEGRLALVAAEGRKPIAEVLLPVTGEGLVAFVGASPRLFTVTRGDDRTTVFAWLGPSLEPLAKLEVSEPMRALAFVGERLLLVSDDGEAARVVTLRGRALAVDPVTLRGPVHIASAAPEERLLVETRGQLEFWDPATRCALFRLNLPLPSVCGSIGFTGRGRLLWVAAREPAGRFEVFRFSDGRKQLQIDLPGPILAVEGSAATNRALIAHRPGANDPVELTHLDLGARERQALEPGQTVGSFALVEGERPFVVLAAAGASLGFLPLGKATGAARPVPIGPTTQGPGAGPARTPEPRPAPSAHAQETGGKRITTAADRFAAWRSRLHGARTGGAAAIPDGTSSDEARPPGADESIEAEAVDPVSEAGPEGTSPEPSEDPTEETAEASADADEGRAPDGDEATGDPERPAASSGEARSAASPSSRPAPARPPASFLRRAAASAGTPAHLLPDGPARASTGAGGASSAGRPPIRPTVRPTTPAGAPRPASPSPRPGAPSPRLTAPSPRATAPSPRPGAAQPSAGSSPRSPIERLRGLSPASRPAQGAAPSRAPAAPSRIQPTRRPSTAEAITPPAGRVEANAPSEDGAWRAALAAWGRRVLADEAGEPEPPPLDGAGAILEVANRFHLETPAVHGLALLYASWLLGQGERGIAPAQLALAIGEPDWREALGRGDLARAGLVRARWGRITLRPVVARLLDGRPVRLAVTAPTAPSADAPPVITSVVRVDDERLDASLHRIADLTGHAVALVDLRGLGGERALARRLREDLFEARVAGAVPLVFGLPLAEDERRVAARDREWIARLGDDAVLVAILGAPPPALAHLPQIPAV